MFGHLKDIFTGTGRRTNPSVVLVLRHETQTGLLDIVPETGDVERVQFTPPAFTYCGTKQQSREQIATVSIQSTYNGINDYLVNIGGSVVAIEQALRSAVFESLESLEGNPSKTEEQSFLVFLVQIDRKKPGKLLGHDDLTSFPRHDQIHGARVELPSPCSGLACVSNYSRGRGVLLDRRPGTPIVELWSTLSSTDQAKVTENLDDLLLQMRAPREDMDYYGRPNEQPYITPIVIDPNYSQAFCRTHQEWSESRVRAVHHYVEESEIDEARTFTARTTTLVTSPVLTHEDLSDRNILIDPSTLQVTGFIDWERSNIAPAYFEYAAARLCGGHEPEWGEVILQVLCQVLRVECDRALGQKDIESNLTPYDASEDLFKDTLAAWNSLVDVERAAQGYSDACYWTSEGRGPLSIYDLQAELDAEDQLDTPENT